MSADTERSEFAKTDTDTDILAKMLAETDTETDNFLSLVNIEATFSAQLDTTGQLDLIKCPKRLEKMLMDKKQRSEDDKTHHIVQTNDNCLDRRR